MSPYYPTLARDVARAKEILAEGKAHEPGCPAIADDESDDEHLDDAGRCACLAATGGTIYGKDTYAAYKLLESFVEAIEAVGPTVCELAMRHDRPDLLDGECVCRTRGCGHPAKAHDSAGNCSICFKTECWS